MPLGHWNLEFLNHNSQRHYPLADTATGVDQTGSFTLPDDFLVELDLPVHAGLDVDPSSFFIQHVGAYSTGYSVIVGYQPASGPAVTVATALIPSQAHQRNATYALGGTGDFDDTVGKLVIGRLDSIANQPPGFWQFDFEATRLDPDAVRPIIRGVSSITCVNGDQSSPKLYGDITLVAGNNMQITPITISGQDPIISFSAINGEGTVDNCVCEGNAVPSSPIYTINGVKPTPAGDIAIVGSACVSVQPITNGVSITDTCAQPCCGPSELEVITQDLERLGSQAASVQQFVNQLQTNVDTMNLIVLGSKLNDAGCSSC